MANGDITLTVPKSIPGVPLGEVGIGILPSPYVSFTFFEGDEKGPSHTVRITASQVTGFNYAAGVFADNIDRAMSGYLTTILGVLFVGNASTLNARKTATVQRLVADGVIVLTGGAVVA